MTVLLGVCACKKTKSNTEETTTAYIVYLQKDSLNSYLKPSTSADTAGIRKKITAYATKILKDRAIPETLIQNSFYNSANSTGFIASIRDEKQITSLKLDKRIDSLHKSISFQGF